MKKVEKNVVAPDVFPEPVEKDVPDVSGKDKDDHEDAAERDKQFIPFKISEICSVLYWEDTLKNVKEDDFKAWFEANVKCKSREDEFKVWLEEKDFDKERMKMIEDVLRKY